MDIRFTVGTVKGLDTKSGKKGKNPFSESWSDVKRRAEAKKQANLALSGTNAMTFASTGPSTASQQD